MMAGKEKYLERFDAVNKKLALTKYLENKLIECIFANSYYQNSLAEKDREFQKLSELDYAPTTDWAMKMHRDSFLQDSMLFSGNRLLIWLNLYRDSYTIKNSGLEGILKFKDGIKFLRDVRTHDYNYSLKRKRDKNNPKIKENYKNYLVQNELGQISPNVTYTFKDSSVEDQHNIGGRFRFDLFHTEVLLAYTKTKEANFFDISETTKEYIELEKLLQETVDVV